MHLILTGATGVVGLGALDAMLHIKEITKISILSRRPVPMAEAARDPRVNVVIHKDFTRYDDPALQEQLRGAAGCVWALGISQTQVSAEEYVTITRDYTLAAARAFAALPQAAPQGTSSDSEDKKPFRFIYVSGEGATQTPGRFTPIFGRVKGETEAALADLTTELAGKLQADSARPAGVDHRGHEAIAPYLPKRFMLRVAKTLSPAIGLLWPAGHSPTGMLGQFLTQAAMGRLDDKLPGKGTYGIGPSLVVGNVGIRRAMGL